MGGTPHAGELPQDSARLRRAETFVGPEYRMSDVAADPRSNRILALLPPAAAQALLPILEAVTLPIATILYGENVDQEYVYFPASGIVSLVYVMHDGSTSELAVVGNDGVVGLLAIMGGGRTTSRAVVQVAGRGWRVPRRVVTDLLARDPAVRTILDRYLMVLFAQMAQTAVCNRHHSVTQQLCRWLLINHDQLDTNNHWC